MATAYRISRNIEASIIKYIKAQLATQWSNFNVEKTQARIYDLPIDKVNKTFAVLVRVSDTVHEFVEVGTTSTYRLPMIIIDIYAVNDGQRLDVKDFLIKKIKKGCDYYEFEVENGSFSSETKTGRVEIRSITDAPVDLDVPNENLDDWDRYRHRLTFEVKLGKVEN